MRFRLLGPLEVVDGNRPIEMSQRQHRVVLAALLLRAGQVVPVDERTPVDPGGWPKTPGSRSVSFPWTSLST